MRPHGFRDKSPLSQDPETDGALGCSSSTNPLHQPPTNLENNTQMATPQEQNGMNTTYSYVSFQCRTPARFRGLSPLGKGWEQRRVVKIPTQHLKNMIFFLLLMTEEYDQLIRGDCLAMNHYFECSQGYGLEEMQLFLYSVCATNMNYTSNAEERCTITICDFYHGKLPLKEGSGYI